MIQQQDNNQSSSVSTLPWVDIIACEECDTLSKRIPLAKGEKALCVCCGKELYQRPRSLNSSFALVCTALIVFIIANCYPIVIVEMKGSYAETTFLGAVVSMFDIGRPFVGSLILITTFIAPLINLLLLFYVLNVVILKKIRPQFFIPAMKSLSALKMWAMIDVFIIGILVTLVKLMGMVIVIPGIALWAFALLSVLMVMLNAISIPILWDEVDRYLT